MDTDVKELNDLLKGLYMGIHSYEHYIKHCQNPTIRTTLQKVQQAHKRSAIFLAERIQNLHGTPATDEGIFGSIIGFASSFTSPKIDEEIIEEAIRMEEKYAVHEAGDNTKGKISDSNKKLIDDILESNQQQVETLRQLLAQLQANT